MHKAALSGIGGLILGIIVGFGVCHVFSLNEYNASVVENRQVESTDELTEVFDFEIISTLSSLIVEKGYEFTFFENTSVLWTHGESGTEVLAGEGLQVDFIGKSFASELDSLIVDVLQSENFVADLATAASSPGSSSLGLTNNESGVSCGVSFQELYIGERYKTSEPASSKMLVVCGVVLRIDG